jgi:hypothetical protein
VSRSCIWGYMKNAVNAVWRVKIDSLLAEMVTAVRPINHIRDVARHVGKIGHLITNCAVPTRGGRTLSPKQPNDILPVC